MHSLISTNCFALKCLFATTVMFLLIISANGQIPKDKKEIIVLSQDDRKPLPYVHFYIHSQNKSFLFISDENGRVAIDAMTINRPDSVTISCIGFKKENTLFSNTKDTVYLKPETYEIGEVIITPKKEKKIKLGNTAHTTFMSYQIGFGKQMVLHIPLNNIEGSIQSVKYFMHSFMIKEFAYRPFRVRIYKEDENGGVGEDIIHDELIVMLARGKGKWLEVDLTPFNLSLPKGGIFVGLEIFSSDFYIKNGYINSSVINGNLVNSVSIGKTKSRHSRFDIQTWDYNPYLGGWNQKYCKDDYLLIQLVVSVNK